MSLRTGEFAQRFIVALDSLEREGEAALQEMIQLFSPMARLTNSAIARGGAELTGEVGARQFWRQYRASFADVHTEFSEVTRSDRAAGLFWTTRGTTRGGKPIEYDGATLLVYEDDGLIIEFRGYYDSRDVEIHLPASRVAETAQQPARA